MSASTHLAASMRDGPSTATSPHLSMSQPSPTSPAYSTGQPSRSFPRDSTRSYTDDYPQSWQQESRRSEAAKRSQTEPMDPPGSGNSVASVGNGPPTGNPLTTTTPNSTSGGSSNPQVEIFKSFRVSIDDPCHKVLPVALKKYNITADWRQYALYIVHGDQERCLGLNEKPLILFKQLDREGRKPMFMLRKHAQPMEGHVSTIPGAFPNQGAGRDSMGGWGGNGTVSLPGGVL